MLEFFGNSLDLGSVSLNQRAELVTDGGFLICGALWFAYAKCFSYQSIAKETGSWVAISLGIEFCMIIGCCLYAE